MNEPDSLQSLVSALFATTITAPLFVADVTDLHMDYAFKPQDAPQGTESVFQCCCAYDADIAADVTYATAVARLVQCVKEATE